MVGARVPVKGDVIEVTTGAAIARASKVRLKSTSIS
jgi:hypothetical protein